MAFAHHCQLQVLKRKIKSRIQLWSGLKLKTLLNIQGSRNWLCFYMKIKFYFLQSRCLDGNTLILYKNFFNDSFFLLCLFLLSCFICMCVHLSVCAFPYVSTCAYMDNSFLLLLLLITKNVVASYKFISFQLYRSEDWQGSYRAKIKVSQQGSITFWKL